MQGGWPAPRPVWPVDRRFVAVIGLAVALHTAFLYRGSSSTLQGERLVVAVPTMLVRMVTPPVLSPATTPPVPEENSAPPPVQEPSIDSEASVAAATAARRAREPRLQPQAAPSPLAPTSAPARRAAATASMLAGATPVQPALPPAPEYAMASGMDPGPQPLDDIVPEYPDGTESRSGYVVLRLLISETGVVDNVAVVHAAPLGLFERAALAAFSAARFSPGRVFGLPVKSQMTIRVDFSPTNRGAKVSGRGY